MDWVGMWTGRRCGLGGYKQVCSVDEHTLNTHTHTHSGRSDCVCVSV